MFKKTVGAIPIIILVAGFFLYQTVAAYEAIEVSDGGTIMGMVKLEGALPEQKALTISKNRDHCGESTPDPRYAIGDGGAVGNVIVTLEGIERGKKAVPVEGASLDNNRCVFQPHVQAVTVGTSLTVTNSDPILHNTHAYLGGKKTIFNLALPLEGQKIKKRLRRPGMMNTKCDAGHTWMSAYIYVSKHPYYAVTDDGGKFSIADVPPGTYKLKAWHEAMGVVEKEVTVPAKGEVIVDFSFKAE